MKNFGEMEAWAYPGTAQFFSGTPFPKTGVRTPPKTPIGIISNYLASTITGTIQMKTREKFWRKASVGISRHC